MFFYCFSALLLVLTTTFSLRSSDVLKTCKILRYKEEADPEKSFLFTTACRGPLLRTIATLPVPWPLHLLHEYILRAPNLHTVLSHLSKEGLQIFSWLDSGQIQ